MNYKGLTLDRFQEQAIAAIENQHSVVVSAPTGSGKTLIADYIINRDVERGIRVIYTAPIKALSNQKYREFTRDYGTERVGLLTGDIVKNPGAPVLIMTTEIYRNMAITRDPMLDQVSYVIFDEIHFINDIERGYVWEESIIFSKPEVRFLCLSATIPNAEEFAEWIRTIKQHRVEVIRHDTREIPLHRSLHDTELGITTPEKIRDVIDIPDHGYVRGTSHRRRPRVPAPSPVELIKEVRDKLPCFFFTFSRQRCQQHAADLLKAKLFAHNPRVVGLIHEKLAGAAPEIRQLASTRLLRELLPYGIGFHHAGLIPVIKELVEELFAAGFINVLYTTETFAVGINMPAKTVCFESLRKFDGANFRFVHAKEYFQIAGRAGRRGIDKEGFAYAMVDRRDFDYHQLKRVTGADREPIRSQFRLSVNTTLNLIKRHPRQEIEEILRKNFYTFQRMRRFPQRKTPFFYTFTKLTKKLEHMGYLAGNILTEKGEFASKMYADELTFTELFATDFYADLDEYQILLLIAALCYEGREKTKFHKTHPSDMLRTLQKKLAAHPFLQRERRFEELEALTALVEPCYRGRNIFAILPNTSLLEGDVIRLFRQMIDRIGQLKGATQDARLAAMLQSCKEMIVSCLAEIDAV